MTAANDNYHPEPVYGDPISNSLRISLGLWIIIAAIAYVVYNW